MTTTLLAADDSVTMRKVLEITFAGESFRTLLASSAEEAVSLAKSERPALVLLDHTLPDMSGYDLCREIKSAVPNVAVVLMSSKVSPYDKARGAASGVDDFMDKPFDTQKLLDKVAQVLAQPRAVVQASAPVAVAPAAAPVAAAPMAAPLGAAGGAARPRSQTLAYGTPAPTGPAPSPQAPPAAPAAPAIARTLPGTVATPRPPVVQAAPAPAAAMPRPVAASAASAASAPVAVAAAPVRAAAPAVAQAIAQGNGQLGSKLEGLGLSPAQVEAVLSLSREVVERVVWEVVPVLAETIIKEEIRRLTSD